jgi:hypothetical protein
MKWLKNIKGVKKLFLTHGDNESREAFKEKVKTESEIHDIILPNQNQEILL